MSRYTHGGFSRDFPQDLFWKCRRPITDKEAAAAAARIWKASGLTGTPSNYRILDLGCGRGEITRAFGRLGAHIVGIDYDPDCIRDATGDIAHDGDVTFIEADAEKQIPTINGDLYDLVYCHYTGWGYGGVERIRLSMQSVAAVLKPAHPFLLETFDGRAVLQNHNPNLSYVSHGPDGPWSVSCQSTLNEANRGIARVDQEWTFTDPDDVTHPTRSVIFEPITPDTFHILAISSGFALSKFSGTQGLTHSTPGTSRLFLRYEYTGNPTVQTPLVTRMRQALFARDAATAIEDIHSLTGRDCLDQSARIEVALRSLPAKEGDRTIAVILPRSWAWPLALLGTRAAGFAFMPLDPEAPQDRIQGILQRVKPDAILCFSNHEDALTAILPSPSDEKITILPPGAAYETLSLIPLSNGEQLPRSASHLFFTSGSTGRPKGVLLEETGLLAVVDAQIARITPAGGKHSLWLLNPSFDASLSDVLCPILGRRILRIHRAPPTRLHELQSAIKDGGVADLPPSMLPILGDDLRHLNCVIFGGERADHATVRRLSRLTYGLQAYGPTETSVCVMMAQATPIWEPGTLGHPLIPGTVLLVDGDGKAWIVVPENDEDPNRVNLRPEPDSIIDGEIVIIGDLVAVGYLDDPVMDAQRFSDINGMRIHRTGDLARYDGAHLLWTGRRDRQIKRNGRMVCPEEVEALVESLHPGTRACCIADGSNLLLAVESETEIRIDLSAVILERLGPAFRPTKVALFRSLPTTPSGKIDPRQAAILVRAAP